MNGASKLLTVGMALPLIYFAGMAVGTLLYPGFDHGARLPSDLGGPSAPGPLPFNLGLILTGLCGVAGGIGLFLALRSLGQPVVGAFCALTMGLFGVAMTMAGVFPLPSPLHYGFNLTLAGGFAPFIGAFAVRGVSRTLLLAAFALSLAIVLIGSGIGGLADEGNIGWWVKGMALVLLPAMAFLCWAVRARLKAA